MSALCMGLNNCALRLPFFLVNHFYSTSEWIRWVASTEATIIGILDACCYIAMSISWYEYEAINCKTLFTSIKDPAVLQKRARCSPVKSSNCMQTLSSVWQRIIFKETIEHSCVKKGTCFSRIKKSFCILTKKLNRFKPFCYA